MASYDSDSDRNRRLGLDRIEESRPSYPVVWIAGIIVLLLVLGGLWYTMGRHSTDPGKTSDRVTSAPATAPHTPAGSPSPAMAPAAPVETPKP